jgi:hypothetical protein
MGLTEWRTRFTTARKYGTTRDFLLSPVSAFFEQLWFCQLRGKHHVKMATSPRCYRCGQVQP